MAAGMERLLLAAGSSMVSSEPVWALILPIEASMTNPALRWMQRWRQGGLSVQMLLEGPLGKRFKKADQRGASWVIVMGPEEWSRGLLRLRHLATGDEFLVAPEAVMERIFSGEGKHA
jgi:histidyl-tRNA synthetase